MNRTFMKWVAFAVAILFFAPVGWKVGGAWGLAAALVRLLMAGNVWGRGRGGEPPDSTPG